MTDIDTEAVATNQPTLPTLELPEYMGRKPIGMKTSITGAGNRISSHHAIGDRVVLVIEGKVKKAGHEDTDDGLVYVETIKVVDQFEVAGQPGRTLLSTMRSAHRTADDARAGVQAIDGLGEVGYTDASGIVLTPREVAALRGDPVRAMVTDELRPVVVVYEDEVRQLWPDDFVQDDPRPVIGQAVLDDGEVRKVAALLDAETGEDLVATVSVPPTSTTFETTFDDPEVIVEDDIPPFDDLPDADAAATDDVPPFDAEPEAPAEPGEAELEARLPRTDDFAFVDRGIPDLRDALEDITDVTQLHRLLNAEKQGRGRGLKYRKGALDVIHARLDVVTSGVRLRLVREA